MFTFLSQKAVRSSRPSLIFFRRSCHAGLAGVSGRPPPERVVVTGLGVVSPLGVGHQTAWQRLLNGDSGAVKLEDDRFSGVPSKVACLVPTGTDQGQFDITTFTKSERESMSLSMMYGLAAAEEAFQDAGWRPASASEKEETGVAIGMGMVDLDYIGRCYSELTSGRGRRISPYFVPRILPNLLPGHISIRHGLQGPNHSCSTACATGSHAIGDAYRMIERGDATAMLCGGMDACVDPLAMMGFSRARALSTKFNSTPLNASRPFDTARDGFVIGEGGALLLLESLNHARKRRAKIYCEVVGYGLSGDAGHITAAREDGAGALLAMERALKHVSDEEKKRIWCFNCHATSTPIGDKAELTAIKRIISKYSGSPPFVTANKGGVGHLLGGAGSLETAFSALSLRDNKIPPCINIENLDPDLVDGVNIVRDANFSPPPAEEAASRRRLVVKNSFGFGGTNVSLALASFYE